MYGKHWSDEELVARLYGVRPEDPHIRACESCTRRWEAIRQRYDSMRPGTVEVSEAFLVAQRRAIEARLGARRLPIRRALVPAMATLLLAAVLVVMRPAPQKPAAVQEISDSQLFDDVFRRASATEPSSVEPIRSLFEEKK
jgi:hypothetical protein